jgi:hypothetical protein
LNTNTRPLIPTSYFGDMAGWELEFEEVPHEIIKRWHFPVAQLTNLPANYIQQFSSVKLSGEKLDLNEFFNEDVVSFIVTSAIKYNTLDNYPIYITTCLLSKKAASLDYLPRGEKLILKDGTEASIFKMLHPNLPSFQVTYLTNFIDLEARKYQITIETDLNVIEDTRFTETGASRISYQDKNGESQQILIECYEGDRESLPSPPLDNSIIVIQKLEPPIHTFDESSNLYIPKFLDLVLNHVVFE